MRAGKHGESLIFNPAHLRPEEELDFCGDCHHTIQQVKQGVFRGVRTVIPQAYRLAGSRCWNAADPRSRCTFCHDPHVPLMRGNRGLRREVPGLPRRECGGPRARGSAGQGLPGRAAGLRALPYAQAVRTGVHHAVHGPPHSHCAPRHALS